MECLHSRQELSTPLRNRGRGGGDGSWLPKVSVLDQMDNDRVAYVSKHVWEGEE